MKTKYISLLLFLFITLTIKSVRAQQDTTQLKQEVEVTKAYQPSISDAFKINDLPQIKEKKTEKPVFEYSIYSEPVFSTFSVKPVQAATMTGTPLPQLEKGLLKAGVGTNLTPYGELFYNAIPGNKSNFGMHFKHLSSHGKIKLMNDDKVKAPYSDNIAELFGKRFFRKSTLTLTGFFKRKGLQYYGYSGNSLTDEEKTAIIPAWQDKQAFSKGGIDLNLKTNSDSKSDLSYDLGVYYHHLGTKTGQDENLAQLKINLGKNFDTFRGILKGGLSFYTADGIANRLVSNSTQRQQILLTISPAIIFSNPTSFLQLGVSNYTMIDDDVSAKFNVMPNLKAEWSPVKNILTLYAHAGGYLDQNIYSKIAEENPFVDPTHDVRDTKYQYIISGGIKGKFSSKTNYVIEASYSGIKDMHFYTVSGVDTESSYSSLKRLNNTFDIEYDDLQLVKFSGEIAHSASDKLNFRLKGNYYSYDLDKLEKPWQMPNFDLNISADYKTTGPLGFSLAAYIIGERKALFINNWSDNRLPGYSNTIYTMDPVFDLNATIDYQYTRQLSFFLQLNNFAFQHYETWLGYTNQGFNVLAGLSFSF